MDQIYWILLQKVSNKDDFQKAYEGEAQCLTTSLLKYH